MKHSNQKRWKKANIRVKLGIVFALVALWIALTSLLVIMFKDKKQTTILATSQTQHTNEQLKVESPPKPTSEETLAEIRKDPAYQNPKVVPYAELFRNSDKYIGEYVRFTGEVVQVLGEPGNWNLRVNVTKYGEYSTYYKDTVYVISTAKERVIENDIIEFTGLSTGVITYESTLGGNITIPSLVTYEHALVGRSD